MPEPLELLTQLSDLGTEAHSIEETLNSALTLIRDNYGASIVTAYRVVDDTCVAWASTGSVDDVLSPMLGLHRYAIETGKPQYVEEQRRMAVPFKAAGTPEALLDIIYGDNTIPVDEIVLISRHIQLILHTKQIATLSQRQFSSLEELNQSRSFEDVAGIIARHMISPGQYVSINLFEKDPSGERYARVVVTANRNETYQVNQRIPADIAYMDKVIEALEKERVYITSSVNDSRSIDPQLRAWLQNLSIKSLYNLPLRTSRGVIGFISVNDTTRRVTPSEAEIDAYLKLADHAAITLENHQLLDQFQYQAGLLEKINEFGGTIQRLLDVEAITERAIRETSDIIPADYVAINLFDQHSDRLFRAAYTTGSDFNIDLTGGDTITQDMNFAAYQAWVNKEPVMIDSLPESGYSHPYEAYVYYVLAVPMFSGTRVTGVFEVASRDHVYQSADSNVAQQLANQLAIAFDNAQDYRQTVRQSQNRALVSTLSATLQSKADLTEMMHVMLSELGSSYGATRARIHLMPRALKKDTAEASE